MSLRLVAHDCSSSGVEKFESSWEGQRQVQVRQLGQAHWIRQCPGQGPFFGSYFGSPVAWDGRPL